MEEVKKVRWTPSDNESTGFSHTPAAFSTMGNGNSGTIVPTTPAAYTTFDFSAFDPHYGNQSRQESSNDEDEESDNDLFPDEDDDDEDDDDDDDDDDTGRQVYYGPSNSNNDNGHHGSDTSYIISPETAHERREWQQMLQSVLRGEVIKSEKKRLLSSDVFQQKNSIQEIWLSLRALLRGRTIMDEIKFLEESRKSIDEVVDTIMQFKVDPNADDPALIQVAEVLKNVDRVESLYATRAEMIQAHPNYDSKPFQVRLDALNAWCTVTRSLHMQFKILRNWTGSDDLQISRSRLDTSSGPSSTYQHHQHHQHHHHQHHQHHQHRRTNSDSFSSIHSINNSNSKSDQHSINTTNSNHSNHSSNKNTNQNDYSFVERILRESALQDTFDKRTLSALNSLLLKSKQTMIANSTLFKEMNLPPFFGELQHLAHFPTRLVEEALKIRLETKDQIIDPPKQMVEAMLEDCRGLLALAHRVKLQYQELAHPAPGWTLNGDEELIKTYDAVVMDATRLYFKLMTWKLDYEKENSLRECEVLEKEWEFLQSTVCRNTDDAYYECTEQFW
jgi:mitogen-activated protein kinase kinase kinase